MKIIVLHGDDSLRSYERLQKFIDVAKSRGLEIEKIYDKSKSVSEVLSSTSLFTPERFFVLEDISLITKGDGEWLKKKIDELDGTLVIFHEGTISKTFLKSIPAPTKIEEFKLPKLIWSFLDSFWPGDATNALKLLHKLTENEPIEFVFALLARHLRDLYWVQNDVKSVPYPSWRVGKLTQQANKFKNSKLSKIINDLADADIKSKTSSENLLDLLDFIIATKLK